MPVKIAHCEWRTFVSYLRQFMKEYFPEITVKMPVKFLLFFVMVTCLSMKEYFRKITVKMPVKIVHFFASKTFELDLNKKMHLMTLNLC
jgi:hypothetical protein